MAPIRMQRDQMWSIGFNGGVGSFPSGWYAAQKSGGDRTAEFTKVRDGGSNVPEVLFTEATTSDITLTGLYRAEDHQGLLRTLKANVGKVTATLTRVDVDANMTAIGSGEQFTNCVLMGVKDPEFDANSSSEARFELTFSVPA